MGSHYFYYYIEISINIRITLVPLTIEKSNQFFKELIKFIEVSKSSINKL